MSYSYTYIVECSNGKYYTGSTKNLEKRVQEHNTGQGANYTKKWKLVKLVYYEEFQNIKDAFFREKQIQGWSHKKKKALIENDIQKLNILSKCNNITSHTKWTSSEVEMPIFKLQTNVN